MHFSTICISVVYKSVYCYCAVSIVATLDTTTTTTYNVSASKLDTRTSAGVHIWYMHIWYMQLTYVWELDLSSSGVVSKFL